MSELVKEIEEAEGILRSIALSGMFIPTGDFLPMAATLQRAREALSWIPVEKWKSKKRDSDFYEVTAIAPGGTIWIRTVLYWSDMAGAFYDPNDNRMHDPSLYTVKAVKPASLPYTPEES